MQGRSKQNVKAFKVDGKDVVCLERNHQNDKIFIVFNFANESSSFSIPALESGNIVMDSSTQEWTTNNTSAAAHFDGNTINLNPYSVLIIET